VEKNENKIELVYYLNILWKRKWFITIFTLIFTASSIFISFIIVSTWEVEALIKLPEFIYQTDEDSFNSVFFAESKKITNRINKGAYNNIIVRELNLDIHVLTELRAEHIQNSNLVRIFIKDKDAEKAKLILYSLINRLKKTYDNIARREISEIDSQIRTKRKERSALKQKLVDKNLLKGSPKNNKKQENIINSEIEEIEKKIEGLTKTIINLNKKKKSISYAELTKEPTSSFSPDYLKKF